MVSVLLWTMVTSSLPWSVHLCTILCLKALLKDFTVHWEGVSKQQFSVHNHGTELSRCGCRCTRQHLMPLRACHHMNYYMGGRCEPSLTSSRYLVRTNVTLLLSVRMWKRQRAKLNTTQTKNTVHPNPLLGVEGRMRIRLPCATPKGHTRFSAPVRE